MSKKLQKTATNQDIPSQVLNPFSASKRYHYTRIEAAPDLQKYIDSHWFMKWDLGDLPPFKLQIASSPLIAITFTPYGCFLTGITTGIYTYHIVGSGVLYGTLFKPGGFQHLYGRSVGQLTDKEMPTSDILPSFDAQFNTSILSHPNKQEAIQLIEDQIRSIPAANDDTATLVETVVDFVYANPQLPSAKIAEHFSLSERRLQELFHYYVGVGTKWISMRFRLQEAMNIAAQSTSKPSWTLIAQELGYSDQSHFINDFKKIIGMSPNQYYKLLERSK